VANLKQLWCYLSSRMQVHRNIDDLPQFRNAVLTIGTFDGVHLGHRQILAALVKEAADINGESVIITFDPHPRKIVQPKTSLQLINTLSERIELLSGLNIDHLVIVPFTKSFADLTADSYIRDFLIAGFHPKSIIIGYDHHFGKNRQGNFKLLEEKKDIYGFKLLEIPRHILEEVGISSTKIRQAIKSGDIEKANKLLGYDFFFEGLVVEGDKLGRTLGYPTANLELTDPDKIHLGEGVYAVTVELANEVKKGMLSIGKRPTLNDTKERIEVNLFDFNEDLYNLSIRISVKKYLRAQVKFDSLTDLKLQLQKDKEASLEALSTYS
jgi:riboflavin kinase / FMN adenylyltransferase